MKTVLVTGGAGYIGQHVCRALRDTGLEPVAFDNLSTGRAETVKWGDLIEGDLLDALALNAAIESANPVAVIHCAAWSDVEESVRNPEKYGDNVRGTAVLAEAAKHLPIVFSSSAAVYGEGGPAPILESAPLNPVNPYGQSKTDCEALLPQAMRLRYFNVAGGSGDLAGHAVPRALLAAVGGRPFVLNGDGSCVRDYVHVEDVAEANVAALICLMAGERGRTLNICSGEGYSVLDVLEESERASGAKIGVEPAEARPGDPSRLVGSNIKAARLIGWRPLRTFEEIVSSAWDAIIA